MSLGFTFMTIALLLARVRRARKAGTKRQKARQKNRKQSCQLQEQMQEEEEEAETDNDLKTREQCLQGKSLLLSGPGRPALLHGVPGRPQVLDEAFQVLFSLPWSCFVLCMSCLCHCTL